MNPCNDYLKDSTELFKLINAQKQETEEAKKLEKNLASYWNQMTEEEKLYVDEQTIRISQWIK